MFSLKRLVTEDLALKLISLALAFLLWLSIAGEQPIERIISTSLDYRNVPDHLEISGPHVTDVDIHIRTRRNVPVSEISAYVDLAGMAPGERIVHLTPQNVRAPSGVEVLRIDPPRIAVRLEPLVSKSVPIVPRIEGRPADGYEFVEARAQPKTITIRGPRSHVLRVDEAGTETITISGKRESFNIRVNATVDDPAVRIDQVAPVGVTVIIRESRKELTVKGVEVRLLSEGELYPSPPKLDVTVRAPLSLADSIRSENLRAVIDAEEITGGSVRPRIEVLGLEGLEIVSFAPPEVTLVRRNKKMRK